MHALMFPGLAPSTMGILPDAGTLQLAVTKLVRRCHVSEKRPRNRKMKWGSIIIGPWSTKTHDTKTHVLDAQRLRTGPGEARRRRRCHPLRSLRRAADGNAQVRRQVLERLGQG